MTEDVRWRRLSGPLARAAMSDAGTWQETVRVVAAALQGAAIVLGAVWGYIKFVQGRTFNKRGELEVAGTLLTDGDASAMMVRVTFRNTGLTRIYLARKVKRVLVYAALAEAWPDGKPIDWGEPVRKRKIFKSHQWVEGQETITDEVLVSLPRLVEAQALAYRIECVLGGVSKGYWKKQQREAEGREGFEVSPGKAARESGDRSGGAIGVKWTTTAIVPGTFAVVERKTGGGEMSHEIAR